MKSLGVVLGICFAFCLCTVAQELPGPIDAEEILVSQAPPSNGDIGYFERDRCRECSAVINSEENEILFLWTYHGTDGLLGYVMGRLYNGEDLTPITDAFEIVEVAGSELPGYLWDRVQPSGVYNSVNDNYFVIWNESDRHEGTELLDDVMGVHISFDDAGAVTISEPNKLFYPGGETDRVLERAKVAFSPDTNVYMVVVEDYIDFQNWDADPPNPLSGVLVDGTSGEQLGAPFFLNEVEGRPWAEGNSDWAVFPSVVYVPEAGCFVAAYSDGRRDTGAGRKGGHEYDIWARAIADDSVAGVPEMGVEVMITDPQYIGVSDYDIHLTHEPGTNGIVAHWGHDGGPRVNTTARFAANSDLTLEITKEQVLWESFGKVRGSGHHNPALGDGVCLIAWDSDDAGENVLFFSESAPESELSDMFTLSALGAPGQEWPRAYYNVHDGTFLTCWIQENIEGVQSVYTRRFDYTAGTTSQVDFFELY